MDNNLENQRAETPSPSVDLIEEDLIEEDDMIDGVLEVEPNVSTGEGGQSGAEQSTSKDEDCALNHEYISYVKQLRRLIILEIKKCHEKQDNISRRIRDLEKQPINPVTRKNWYHLFGFPYFKDKSFFPCPMNEDQRIKLSRCEIDYHKIQHIRRWTEGDCLKLERGVKKNAIEKKTSGLMLQRGLVLEELKDSYLTVKKKAALRDRLKKIDNSIKEVKKIDPITLLGDINMEYDWLKIAAEEFEDLRSSEEVQAMWKLCRHPSINRKHWSPSENEALFEIARKHKEQDWALIASELNNNRTEFQCIIQYQRKLNRDFINHRWSEEEDAMLKFVVEKCRVNDYIPWSTVSMCMKNRTRNQVYNRWTYGINPHIRKGRFSEKEDCLILAGVKHFGTDYGRIAELLPGRTSAQVNARYSLCLSRDGPLGQWSVDEDERLLELVEIHGKNWNKLSREYFEVRSRTQIRHRYLYLEEWLSKNPDCTVSKAPRRDLGDLRRRNSNLWSTIQRALTTSDKARRDKDINKEDMELLQLTLSNDYHPIKRLRVPGRKKKVFTKADKLLHRLLKSCYSLPSGRKKNLFTKEELQKREDISLKLLNVLQAHLAFPIDESVIMNDPALNLGDKNILVNLKKKYDQVISGSCGEGSSVPGSVTPLIEQHPHNSKLTSSLPFYRPQENIRTPFPELLPGFIKNLVGLRTMLLSRINLRTWKSYIPDPPVSLPAFRPTSQELHCNRMECLSKEQSAKLFAERMFSLFYWPTQLVRVPPEFDDAVLLQSDSNAPPKHNPKRSRKSKKRTLKDQSRSRSLIMKNKWKKFREEKSKNESKTNGLSF